MLVFGSMDQPASERDTAPSPHPDHYSAQLRSHLQALGIPSFRALAQTAEVSRWAVQQLRQGKADQLRGAVLHRLSQTLHLSMADLLAQFSSLDIEEAQSPAPSDRSPPSFQPDPLQPDPLQQNILQQLESWMIQWPTAAYAAQQNPNLPAQRLLPLLRPLEQLLQQWGVEAIATVGTQVPYDPHCHQLMDGTAQPGDWVNVRYVGYRQGDRLLYRAKVSPIQGPSAPSHP